MRKTFKSISVFFLWLAWLFILAHQVIPHDHHMAESVSYRGDSCPLSNNKPDHHHEFPVHCHALNDLTSEKVNAIILKNQIPDNELSFTEYTDIFEFEYKTTPVNVFEKVKFFPDHHILELSLLRAPPIAV
jgi:hypothetical protein